MALAPPASPDADADPTADAPGMGDASSDVLVTIARGPDGGYVVYSGDEPDDDEGAEPGAPAAPAASQGQPADSIGAALKAALDILNEDASSAGAPGSSDDQFAAGFTAGQAPTPAASPRGRGLKYPPKAAAA